MPTEKEKKTTRKTTKKAEPVEKKTTTKKNTKPATKKETGARLTAKKETSTKTTTKKTTAKKATTKKTEPSKKTEKKPTKSKKTVVEEIDTKAETEEVVEEVETKKEVKTVVRPRPGALRALHRREPHARFQRHAGLHLPEPHRQGAQGRLSGRHGAGHPACHQRHQGSHPQPGRQHASRHRHHRDRRHGGRYRVPALHRGRAPMARRARRQERVLRPCDPRALHRRSA